MNPLEYHQNQGKMAIMSKVPLENKNDLALAYTPGVGEVCMAIKNDKELAKKYTFKGNIVAVVTDGTAVLGFGDIGPEAGLPVMEGKCLLLKKFGGVDAIPLCLDTKDTEEIIKICKAISPTFGAIQLEDISAPRCFEIEERLQKELNIPVYHDDQHGTAIVALAGLYNALRLNKKDISQIKVVVNGAGAAGIAFALLAYEAGVRNLLLLDSKGICKSGREGMNPYKEKVANMYHTSENGDLRKAVKDADVFVGVSVAGAFDRDMLISMKESPIVFCLANPVPEMMPDEAEETRGDVIYASGRGDSKWSQINNVLAFPGMFRGALDNGVKSITMNMKLKASKTLASLVKDEELSKEYILPNAFDERACDTIAKVIY